MLPLPFRTSCDGRLIWASCPVLLLLITASLLKQAALVHVLVNCLTVNLFSLISLIRVNSQFCQCCQILELISVFIFCFLTPLRQVGTFWRMVILLVMLGALNWAVDTLDKCLNWVIVGNVVHLTICLQKMFRKCSILLYIASPTLPFFTWYKMHVFCGCFIYLLLKSILKWPLH